MLFPFWAASSKARTRVGSVKKEPSMMAVSMRVMSMRTMRPAPRFKWPTSLLPI